MQVVNPVDFELDTAEIGRRLGISEESREWQAVRDLMLELHEAQEARCLYKPCFIQEKDSEHVVIEEVSFKSKVLGKNLEQVNRVFPFVLTLGQGVDDKLKEEEDFLRQYYLDTIANVALQDVLGSLCAHLQDAYHIDQLSYMSPGSLQDWPIDQQRPLFRLLGNVEEELGVRLAQSMLMYPSKSESGMFFPTEVTFFNCQLCPHESCPSRKAAFDEEKAREYGVL